MEANILDKPDHNDGLTRKKKKGKLFKQEQNKDPFGSGLANYEIKRLKSTIGITWNKS